MDDVVLNLTNDQKSLKGPVTSGLKWSFFSQFVRQATQWLTVTILARLLLPSDFGLVGMAMVVIGFLNIYKDLGTSSSIVQKINPSQKLLSSVFWINVIFGILATIVLFFLAPLFASFFNESKVEIVLKILAFNFLISSFTVLHQGLCQKKMTFRKLAWIEVSSVLSGSVVGIVLAVMGMGVFSLVFQTIVTTFITSCLLWLYVRWSPSFYLGFAELREISKYSLNLTGFNTINYFLRNADSILIGRFLGSEQLGFYSVAYRIMLYPLQNVSLVLGRVMFPAYSHIQNDNAKIRRLYLRVAGAIAFIVFPMVFGLMAISKPFVFMMFGLKWETLIYLLIILSPVGMIQSITTTTGSIYLAKGKTDWMMWWGGGAGIVVIASFIIGLNWGVIGVAISYAVATILLIYPCLTIPFYLIGLKISDLLKVIAPSFFCSMAMFFLIIIVKIVFFSAVSSYWMLIVVVSIALSVYSLASWSYNRDRVLEFLSLIGIGVKEV